MMTTLLNEIEEDDIATNLIATAETLISNGSVNLNDEPWPLLRAAEHGCVEAMTMLLDAGANINVVDNVDCTACHFAISKGHFDALKLLVERGANVVDSNRGSESLLSIAARYFRNERFVILLLDAGAPIDGLSTAALMQFATSAAVFKRLVARNVDFTAMRDELGRKLCHCVAYIVTCEDDLRFLLGACGDDSIHAEDNECRTPLHWAASSSNESAMRILVEFGAEIDRADDGGWTALFNASGAGAESYCVELLLALGADVGLVTNSGRTACHLAAGSQQRSAVLCALVAAGGNLDRLDNENETPRSIAVAHCNPLPTDSDVTAARRRIAKSRLDLVRERAFQICVGLHSLEINTLQLCEIMMHSFGALGSLIAFHEWWAIATKVKHFHANTKTKTKTNKQKK